MAPVAFAAASGLRPDKDYRAVAGIFDGIDAAEATEHFAFGRDGKPTYIPGPNDGPGRTREVRQALEKAHGPDGWTFDFGVDLTRLERLIEDGKLDIDGFDDDDLDDGLVIDHEGPTEPPRG